MYVQVIKLEYWLKNNLADI